MKPVSQKGENLYVSGCLFFSFLLNVTRLSKICLSVLLFMAHLNLFYKGLRLTVSCTTAPTGVQGQTCTGHTGDRNIKVIDRSVSKKKSFFLCRHSAGNRSQRTFKQYSRVNKGELGETQGVWKPCRLCKGPTYVDHTCPSSTGR